MTTAGIAIIVLMIVCCAGFFAYKSITKAKETKQLYQTLLNLYFESRNSGKSPEEACMEALEKKYTRAANVKTKIYFQGLWSDKVKQGKLPEEEKKIFNEMFKIAARIDTQSFNEQEESRQNEILEGYFNEIKKNSDDQKSA